MSKRDTLATTAAISNGMVWFGLALFIGVFAVQLAPAAFAGELSEILGWAMLALAAVGLLAMGLLEQRTMRSARAKTRHAP